MSYKRWVVRDADKERASAISEKFNIDPFIAFMLVSRGIEDDLSVSRFLSDSCELVSPFSFTDMEEASFVIGDAVDNGDKICIYGDYDSDGVTSTALLYSFLKDEGADVCYYIPDREKEGYGLNMLAIDKIYNMGVNLIVTVDNGISAIDEANHIYELGMSLVVTDHHQLSSELPRAEAVVNPHRPENALTFRDYCGVGVAFKLVCAMSDEDDSVMLKRYADLVAIGTIADVMPLTDENRVLVKAGLNIINSAPRQSIQAFIDSNGNKKYSSTDIAFQLCPRINAMGRMGDASRAVEFLINEDADECKFMCSQLSLENSNRQQTEKDIFENTQKQIADNPALISDRVIVLAGEGYHFGVIGIVASRIVDKYGKPAIVIGIDENGVAHGSARSVEGFNIFEAISSCDDLLIRFGGHPLAAGITLEPGDIDAFRKRINSYALENYPSMPAQELTLDCKLSPFYLSLDLVDNLSMLEPYGEANPQAVFGIFNMKLISVTPISEGKHIRLELEKKGRRIRAVKFGVTAQTFAYSPGDFLSLAVKVSKNLFRDKMYLSVQAVDIKLASADDDRYFEQKNIYDIYCATGSSDKSLYPTREICAVVYNYLKKNGGFKYSVDDLYFRLQQSVTYGQLMFALRAFEESGLISIGDAITLNSVRNKVKLEDTQVLRTLKESFQL